MTEKQRHRPLRISPGEAHDIVENQRGILLDVVSHAKYEKVPDEARGARRIDPDDIEQEHDQLSIDRPVAAYCT